MSAEDYLMRPLAMSDLDAMEKLERECFTLPWSRYSFANELKNRCARYIVLEAEGVIVGYAGMWVVIDEGHITNVAVSPDHRQKGYGKSLMLELMRRALEEGVCLMTLEVRKSNDIAQTLYTQLGFEPCGLRKGYYTDNGEDAVLMWNRALDASLAAMGKRFTNCNSLRDWV